MIKGQSKWTLALVGLSVNHSDQYLQTQKLSRTSAPVMQFLISE